MRLAFILILTTVLLSHPAVADGPKSATAPLLFAFAPGDGIYLFDATDPTVKFVAKLWPLPFTDSATLPDGRIALVANDLLAIWTPATDAWSLTLLDQPVYTLTLDRGDLVGTAGTVGWPTWGIDQVFIDPDSGATETIGLLFVGAGLLPSDMRSLDGEAVIAGASGGDLYVLPDALVRDCSVDARGLVTLPDGWIYVGADALHRIDLSGVKSAGLPLGVAGVTCLERLR